MTASRLHRWSPALRRALMKVRPEYFGWSPAEQERYGVAIPEKDHEHLCWALLQELWGRKIRSPKAAARTASRLSLDEQHRWNEIVLPLTGIGDDCFLLNEGFAAGKTILDFPTLLAYDESDYRFQEEARRKDDSSYQGETYRGSLYLTWARLFVGAQFTYATLSMAAGYVLCALGLLEELHRAVEQEKIELTGFIRKDHDELRRTLDPSVVRLRKRRKILVHQDAFEDLE